MTSSRFIQIRLRYENSIRASADLQPVGFPLDGSPLRDRLLRRLHLAEFTAFVKSLAASSEIHPRAYRIMIALLPQINERAVECFCMRGTTPTHGHHSPGTLRARRRHGAPPRDKTDDA